MKNLQSTRTQSGSIFTILLVAVTLTGVLSFSLYQIMTGPLATIVRVTNANSAKIQMQTIAASLVVSAAQRSTNSGDCDSDTIVEPDEWRAASGVCGALPCNRPKNGGLIPNTLGTTITDPYGTDYGYCGWDIGAANDPAIVGVDVVNCPAGARRLKGTPNPAAGIASTQTVIAVISAGPDRRFNTTCNNYVDASTDEITAGGDDVVLRYTYQQASGLVSGMWSLKLGDPTTTTITKNIDVQPSGGIGGRITAGAGLTLGDETVVASCSTAGLMRYNTVTKSVDVCDGLGNWKSAGGVLAIDDLNDARTYYTSGSLFLGSSAGGGATTDGPNTAVGYQALRSITNTNTGATALGYQALRSLNTVGSYDTAVGHQALYTASTGAYNNALGYQALYTNATGAASNAVGYQALYLATSSSNNAFGHQALNQNSTGTPNDAFGYQALYNNTTGGSNAAFGYQALYTNATGSNNSAVGDYALYGTTVGKGSAFGFQALANNSTGTPNDAFGYQALYNNTTGGSNTALGYQTLYTNTVTGSLIAVGYQSLYSNTTGASGTGVGYQALYTNTTGGFNTALGYKALNTNSTGSANTGVGYQALYTNTGGINTAVGYNALYSNTTASGNNAFGDQALYTNTTGQINDCVGYQCLFTNSTGSFNQAFGYRALYNNTVDSNIGMGFQALYSNTSGTPNSAFGYKALYSNTTGAFNTALGYQALYTNTGDSNVAVGYQALYSTAAATGNVAVGTSAGNAGTANTVGTYNTFIGYQAQANANNYTNSTALGNTAVITASNRIVLGNASIAAIYAQVTSITAISDRRRKKDIAPMGLGLDFINKLNPVSYRFNNGDDTLRYGFIAQEVEDALGPSYRDLIEKEKPEHDLALISRDSDKDRTYHLTYGELFSPIVKAIQEVNRKLEGFIAETKKSIAALMENDKKQAEEIAGLRKDLEVERAARLTDTKKLKDLTEEVDLLKKAIQQRP